MLQVTPLLIGSFVTVAVKLWLPLVRRLAVDGTTATEIAGPPPPGAVVSEPQAASRNRPDATESGRDNESVFMIDPIRGSRRLETKATQRPRPEPSYSWSSRCLVGRLSFRPSSRRLRCLRARRCDRRPPRGS